MSTRAVSSASACINNSRAGCKHDGLRRGNHACMPVFELQKALNVRIAFAAVAMSVSFPHFLLQLQLVALTGAQLCIPPRQSKHTGFFSATSSHHSQAQLHRPTLQAPSGCSNPGTPACRPGVSAGVNPSVQHNVMGPPGAPACALAPPHNGEVPASSRSAFGTTLHVVHAPRNSKTCCPCDWSEH